MQLNYGNIDPVRIWVGFYVFSHWNGFCVCAGVDVHLGTFLNIVLQALTGRCMNKRKHHLQTCMT